VFVQKSKELAASRIPSDPFDPSTLHGPQIDDIQFNKILAYIEKGQEEGATLEVGGNRHGISGYYIEPTVFSNVTDDMTIAREEIFGPVQSILKFSTLEEAIQRANDTQYGLAAGIITPDNDKIIRFTQGMRTGTVYVNTFLYLAPQCPFGGYKMSGHGRELGEDAIHDFVEIKTVIMATPVKNS